MNRTGGSEGRQAQGLTDSVVDAGHVVSCTARGLPERRSAKSSDRLRAASLVETCLVAMLLLLAGRAGAQSSDIRLTADARSAGTPLVHFWSKMVGAGRANEALRATWQEELRTVHQYDGFEYVRFHGIFHDDMFVYREDKDGNAIYNFQYVDDVFDRMLDAGVKPFVELGFVPKELATVTNTDFWWQANGSPPRDNAKWVALVRALVEHCIARYGLAQVRSWYFEVWNEPNLRYFFKNGTQAQYFELYRVTALELKKIDPELRVGGPATSNFRLAEVPSVGSEGTKKLADQARHDGTGGDWQPVWVKDFLQFCAVNHLPLDFLSTHPYPTDFPLDVAGQPESRVRRNIDSTRMDLMTLRQMVDGSAFPKAEIDLTEWSSSPSGLDHSHDSVAAAAFIAKTNLESAGLVDALSYWVFTDVFEEARETDSIFHGGFGLINYQQIVKPAFHAYRFLNMLGDTKLAQGAGGIVTRQSGAGVRAMFYNYPAEVQVSLPKSATVEEADRIVDTGSPRQLLLTLTGLRPGALFELEMVDRSHANPVATWEAMGRPEPPTRDETRLLQAAAWATEKELLHADAKGTLILHKTLPAWAILSVREIQ